MYDQIEDCEKDGFDVAEAAARPPNWFSYSSYSMQQDQLQDPSYQYPDPGNTGEWYSAPSAPAEISAAASTATTYLGHSTATPQTTLRRAHATSLYYSDLGSHGQNPAFAGTAAESAYPTTPLQPEGYYEADSNIPFTGNSASPSTLSTPSTSAATSFAAHGGYVSGQRPVGSGNTRSGARTLPSRRARTSTQQSYHPHQDQYSHPTSQYLEVPGHPTLAPTTSHGSPTSPSRSTIPSPAPSSTSHGTFLPQQCKWEDCGSSTIFQREGDLIRHLKTIHISPNAYPCPEPECPRAFGRNDHLKNHLKTIHRF